MGKDKGKKFPKKAVKEEIDSAAIRANSKEIKTLGLVTSELKENLNVYHLTPYVALKYYRSDWQCFSEWESSELKEFSSFLENLKKYTWDQVYRTGSKVPKHGLGYTKYDVEDVKSSAIKSKLKSVQEEISEDINFFELRVNQNKLRVHGFQSHSAFFLVALDRNHEAFPA